MRDRPPLVSLSGRCHPHPARPEPGHVAEEGPVHPYVPGVLHLPLGPGDHVAADLAAGAAGAAQGVALETGTRNSNMEIMDILFLPIVGEMHK